MNGESEKVREAVDATLRRSQCRQELAGDPAVWAWIVVVVLALLPLGSALAGM